MASTAEPKPRAAPTSSTPNTPKVSNSQPSDYYGYLFDEYAKTPTSVFDALLRAMAQHISTEIGDKQDRTLKGAKLAQFYKSVGGNYDKVFLSAPNETLSFLWQILGCFHSLQPTDNCYEAPSVPALTIAGFVRWQSIQILLSPEEHVPFVIFAVKNWNLKHPDTGELFPKDISAAAFPTEPDADIVSWHEACGTRLRQEAEQRQSPSSPRQPAPSAADRVNAGFSHV
ncbi:hypothetical protein BD289DRAFT_363874, partial [Coniella lustricola]